MGLETVLLVGRPGDEGNGTTLAETARDIAKPANARVIVGQVFTDDEYDNVKTSIGVADDAEVTADEIAEGHGTFRSIVAVLDAAGVDYESRTVIGPHTDSIVDLAADVDLVIIGGTKRSPAGKAIFGSTTQDVLLEVPCPVVFVRRD